VGQQGHQQESRLNPIGFTGQENKKTGHDPLMGVVGFTHATKGCADFGRA
jgi:hypothetical protein